MWIDHLDSPPSNYRMDDHASYLLPSRYGRQALSKDVRVFWIWKHGKDQWSRSKRHSGLAKSTPVVQGLLPQRTPNFLTRLAPAMLDVPMTMEEDEDFNWCRLVFAVLQAFTSFREYGEWFRLCKPTSRSSFLRPTISQQRRSIIRREIGA